MNTHIPHDESHGQRERETRGAPAAAERSRPRTGPIVWGALFLAFCAWITQRTFFPGALTPELWFTFTAIGLGTLLLAVGITVAVKDRGRVHYGDGEG